MKWDFFYDEGNDKSYESIGDWYEDIKHLILPTIIIVILGVAVLIYFSFFHWYIFHSMKEENLITKEIADSIIKICFDIAEFTRLYEHDEVIKQVFQCNNEIKKGLKWFVGSRDSKEMYNNVEAYIQATERTLELYNNLNAPFRSEENLIITLKNLRSNLLELQNQIKQKI